MRGRALPVAAAALIVAFVATPAWADAACDADLEWVDTYGRLKFESQVTARPSWAVVDPRCGDAGPACESFLDPEGVAYSLIGDGYVGDKQLAAAPGVRLPWGLTREDTREVVEQKLRRLLPDAAVGLREDRSTPTFDVALPGCESIWIEVEVGPAGVNWVSLNAQP